MDKVDFSNDRVMVLGAKTHSILLLRSLLAMVGVGKIVCIEDSRRAIELLGMEHFSAVFVGPDAPGIDGVSFAVAARRKEGMLNPMIPIFALRDRARRRDVEQARDEGVTDVLTVPLSPRTLMTKLGAAFETPRPFIVSSQFFGPDRRAGTRPAWFGKDRRKRAPRKAKADLKPHLDITHI